MKKILSLILVCVFLTLPFSASANEISAVYPYDIPTSSFWGETAAPAAEFKSSGDAKALCLMEFSTGNILYAENATEHLPIASVTKVTAMLLVIEALDEGRISPDDEVTVSANAASMGGSQIFLEENETMSVNDLLKSVAVASANDATVALGEYLCGSESTFIDEMNIRAKALGCENTHYANTNGLPTDDHYSCALDVALVTRELMKHERIFEYTKIWMDTVRGGAFGLANTNKLLRFYKGATGMKTGYTGEAGYCLSGTAERDGMALIAVVLGASSSDKRFAEAKALLDYGFATRKKLVIKAPEINPLKVLHGKAPNVSVSSCDAEILTDKASSVAPEVKIVLPEYTEAPVKAGDVLGYVSYSLGGEEVERKEIFADCDVERATFLSVLGNILGCIFNSF